MYSSSQRRVCRRRFRTFTLRLSHSGGMLRSFATLEALDKLPKLTGDEYCQLLQWFPSAIQLDCADEHKEAISVIAQCLVLNCCSSRDAAWFDLSPFASCTGVSEDGSPPSLCYAALEAWAQGRRTQSWVARAEVLAAFCKSVQGCWKVPAVRQESRVAPHRA